MTSKLAPCWRTVCIDHRSTRVREKSDGCRTPQCHLPFLNERFLPRSMWPFWVGSALTAGGLLFAVWARSHHETNWSTTVTNKKGHEPIMSGPYAFVRHPICTWLLQAFVGTALPRGEFRGIVAVILVSWSLWRKFQKEDRWMHQVFGDSYERYARRVAAKVPFVL